MSRLAGLVADARARVAAGAYRPQGDALPSHGSLVEALDQDAAIIAELKPRSPSAGRLLDGDPADVLADYAAGGAAAVSVLTDSDHFDGSPELLRAAHAVGLPTLMKDFIVDESQLDAAAHHGASAVLLIERILEPERRERLVEAAHGRGLEVLLEVFDADDWDSARHSHADLIGVNQRDLDTLKMDPAGQLDLIQHIAVQRPVVALSGIKTRRDRQHAERAGATACLVGTSIMTHPHRRLALTALRRPLVKVCGITSDVDLGAAVDAGADMAGFIVLADSPRSIPVEDAARLVAEARAAGTVAVMVTPAMSPDEVVAAAKAVRPDFVQWHNAGDGIRHALRDAGIGLWHAISPGASVPGDTDGLVLDAPGGGGSGEVHDWSAAAAVVGSHPHVLTLIAGGLDAENVRDALRTSGAWGADASSRLESAPGQKDPAKVRAYVQTARATRD